MENRPAPTINPLRKEKPEMTVTERVRETATDLKEDLRETVDHLREEVAQLKAKVGQAVPFRKKEASLPVRTERPATLPFQGWPALFEDAWFAQGSPPSRFPSLLGQIGPGFVGESPRVDVTETEREVQVRVELPGVDKEDIDLSLSGNMLGIRGEKTSEIEDEAHGFHRHECTYGSFVRSVGLPCDVQGDRADARFQKGVLKVTLPKTSEARNRVRRIAVRRG
ncbi:MAG: hypothetical protein DHS20C21_00990 [Gemmatimonadota bacterium]|nr:MAG: hypothetical protein DHS20C21_00990 [Gemmatimonadota bacterium]